MCTAEGPTSSKPPKLHRLTRSTIFSEVLSVSGRDVNQMEPRVGRLVGGPRQFKRPCETSHCRTGGKSRYPDKVASSILAEFQRSAQSFW